MSDQSLQGRFLVCVLAVFTSGCGNATLHREIEQAQAQVRRIVAELDQRTTETGVYVRIKDDDIVEIDPWSTRIEITYSQGGIAETVSVRSAGPDRLFHSDDDVVAQASTTNLKGVGEGIKKNSEEVAKNVGKGLVKGVVSGVKEVLPFKKKGERAEATAEGNDGGQADADPSNE
ncbi:MAG: hypothetical protein R3C05_18845 [Pirellulaceae bacterium]